MKVLSLCVILFLGSVSASPQFEAWKAKHGKSYATPEEEAIRSTHYHNNVAKINAHNADPSQTYTLAENHLTDMHPDEVSATMKGYRKHAASRKITPVYDERLYRQTPALAVDWRNHSAVNPIKDQAQCGSCWAFSAISALESQWAIVHKTLPSLSEQMLVDCGSVTGNAGCDGGDNGQAYLYLQKSTKGAEKETVYPYKAVDGTCHYKAANSVAAVKGYNLITSGSESALQAALSNIGPMSICINAGLDSFQSYSSGVYNPTGCTVDGIDHCVTAVGYGHDTKSGLDYYIVRNQWGTGWGMKGYIWMVRNSNNNCGVASEAYYPLV